MRILLLLLLYVTKREGKAVPVHAIKHTAGVEILLHSFLTSALEGSECCSLQRFLNKWLINGSNDKFSVCMTK
jgi:hypothetical protein